MKNVNLTPSLLGIEYFGEEINFFSLWSYNLYNFLKPFSCFILHLYCSYTTGTKAPSQRGPSNLHITVGQNKEIFQNISRTIHFIILIHHKAWPAILFQCIIYYNISVYLTF